MYISIYDTWRS